jgi:serine/threonine protein kinase
MNKANARYCASCGARLETEPAEAGLLQAGQLVDGGTYRILRLLGKGGMGAVYLAANTKAFDRRCVVKEIIEYYDPADPEARRKAVERFEAEARTLAALKHPGIPDIYAYFTERGRNYLVMEYIEGPDLSQELTRDHDGRAAKGGLLPVEEVIGHVLQICEVLAYLEQQNPPVVHNDIKPANIILDKNTGSAVLVDFGTANTRYRGLQAAGQAANPPGQQQPSVYGTIGYAAPELYEGKAEPKSDVFALAATAYHLLTNDDPRTHPFQFPKLERIPEPPRRALADALEFDVKKRLSAAELSARLQKTFAVKAATSSKVQVAPPKIVQDLDQGDASQISVANAGSDEVRGTVGASQPWIQIAQEFKCGAGQTCTLPMTIDVKSLTPGRTYRGMVHIRAPGTAPSTIPVEVRVPPPLLDIRPMEVDLGTVSQKEIFTRRGMFKVENIGKSRAICQIDVGAPWLVLDPYRFTCLPGQTQTVELVGRRDLAPPQGERHSTTLQLNVEGGYSRQVQVSFGIRQTRRSVVSAVMIGSAIVVLMGAIFWFVVSVLPLLLP